ncbi:unnamed protein product [Owenia fusiformis]|uniref:Uncharacterized protein n=1 Tax=Owenia fusiformis TaxID=6347 RepID=A0A8J1THP5_OWEFU|nr:unnamed protein product [Owenia fusiformis]
MSKKRCLILATIVSVGEGNVFYPSCHLCFSKLLSLDTKWFCCSKCNNKVLRPDVNHRYRLSLVIQQDSFQAKVVLFGKCVQHFFGINANGLQRYLSTLEDEHPSVDWSQVLKSCIDCALEGAVYMFGFKTMCYAGQTLQGLVESVGDQDPNSVITKGANSLIATQVITTGGSTNQNIFEHFKNNVESQIQLSSNPTLPVSPLDSETHQHKLVQRQDSHTGYSFMNLPGGELSCVSDYGSSQSRHILEDSLQVSCGHSDDTSSISASNYSEISASSPVETSLNYIHDGDITHGQEDTHLQVSATRNMCLPESARDDSGNKSVLFSSINSQADKLENQNNKKIEIVGMKNTKSFTGSRSNTTEPLTLTCGNVSEDRHNELHNDEVTMEMHEASFSLNTAGGCQYSEFTRNNLHSDTFSDISDFSISDSVLIQMDHPGVTIATEFNNEKSVSIAQESSFMEPIEIVRKESTHQSLIQLNFSQTINEKNNDKSQCVNSEMSLLMDKESRTKGGNVNSSLTSNKQGTMYSYYIKGINMSAWDEASFGAQDSRSTSKDSHRMSQDSHMNRMSQDSHINRMSLDSHRMLQDSCRGLDSEQLISSSQFIDLPESEDLNAFLEDFNQSESNSNMDIRSLDEKSTKSENEHEHCDTEEINEKTVEQQSKTCEVTGVLTANDSLKYHENNTDVKCHVKHRTSNEHSSSNEKSDKENENLLECKTENVLTSCYSMDMFSGSSSDMFAESDLSLNPKNTLGSIIQYGTSGNKLGQTDASSNDPRQVDQSNNEIDQPDPHCNSNLGETNLSQDMFSPSPPIVVSRQLANLSNHTLNLASTPNLFDSSTDFSNGDSNSRSRKKPSYHLDKSLGDFSFIPPSNKKQKMKGVLKEDIENVYSQDLFSVTDEEISKKLLF